MFGSWALSSKYKAYEMASIRLNPIGSEVLYRHSDVAASRAACLFGTKT